MYIVSNDPVHIALALSPFVMLIEGLLLCLLLLLLLCFHYNVTVLTISCFHSLTND